MGIRPRLFRAQVRVRNVFDVRACRDLTGLLQDLVGLFGAFLLNAGFVCVCVDQPQNVCRLPIRL